MFTVFWFNKQNEFESNVCTREGILYRVPECLSSVKSLELGPPTSSTTMQRVRLPPLGYWGEPHSLSGGGGGGEPNSDDWTDTLVFYIVIPLRVFVYKFSQAYNSLVITSRRLKYDLSYLYFMRQYG